MSDVLKMSIVVIYYCLVLFYFILMVIFILESKKFFFAFSGNSSNYFIPSLQVMLHCVFSPGGAIILPMMLIAKISDFSLFKMLVLMSIFLINIAFSYIFVSVFFVWVIYQMFLLRFVIYIIASEGSVF